MLFGEILQCSGSGSNSNVGSSGTVSPASSTTSSPRVLALGTFGVDLDSIIEESPSSPRCSYPLFSPLPQPPATSSCSRIIENLHKKRKSMFRRNQSSSNLVGEKRRTIRRPLLPSITPIFEEMSSSVGHARSRRPSLHTDWSNDHRMMMADNRIHNIEIEPPINFIIASFKDIDNSLEKIHFENGMRLYEAFEPSLRARGLTINEVEFFLEKSSTPIPENSEARYLAEHKIFVRGELLAIPLLL
ncbi:unnamed protein product [Caenorhabditis bovis]|uniref:Uncharacterized protein n=1 Tax=Caenorhabditis bovis TaxID=2654633 RepID=A0A8S1EVL5_9PELO|nr:unnamed protein product [Caenorhabditis bovis]